MWNLSGSSKIIPWQNQNMEISHQDLNQKISWNVVTGCDLTMSLPWNQDWKPWGGVDFPLNIQHSTWNFQVFPSWFPEIGKNTQDFRDDVSWIPSYCPCLQFFDLFGACILDHSPYVSRRRCWACCSQPPVSRCWLWRLHGVAGGADGATAGRWILRQRKLRIKQPKFWLNNKVI